MKGERVNPCEALRTEAATWHVVLNSVMIITYDTICHVMLPNGPHEQMVF